MSNGKYYLGGAIIILLLFWPKKSSAKPQIQEAPKKKNILDDLPNSHSFAVDYSHGPQSYVREVFNSAGNLVSIPASQNGPVINATAFFPDPNTVYAIRLSATPVPASGFLEKIEDLGDSIGIAVGGVDAGLAVGGKVAKFGVSASFLRAVNPGRYVVAMTAKPEQRKLPDGKIETITLTSDQMNQLPRSYAIVTIPPFMA